MSTLTKIRDDRHGPVNRVETDDGEFLGIVGKWHGLFEATDTEGTHLVFDTRKGAVAWLEQEETRRGMR